MERKKSRIAMLKNAEAAIHPVFDRMPKAVLKGRDLEGILEQNRRNWRLSDWTTPYEFLQFMLEESKLRMVRFEFPGRAVLRYTWGDASIYEMALSLRANSFFCHQTAIYLHGLSEEVPKTIYLNSEQTPKPQSSTNLSQAGIDRAFRGKPRMSGNVAQYRDSSICILNGKSSGRVGVVDIESPDGTKVPVTGLERTLLDITVRPFYAGGVFEVLKAFQKAGGKLSVAKLMDILNKLDYVYPYHQAIGFYLEKSGAYNASAIRLFRKPGIKFDFYLTYGMKQMEFSEGWRMYYPKGL